MTAEAGATVSAYLTSLIVGQNGTTFADGMKVIGKLDWSQAALEAFDVSEDVTIGFSNKGNYGEVSLSAVSGKIGRHLTVGDSVAESAGRLELHGTHLEVGGDVAIALTGRIKVLATGDGTSGLLLSNASSLAITAFGSGTGDEEAGYFIDFTGADFSGEGLHYGLAWEGDHSGELQSLIDSFAITWINPLEGPQAGLYYDSSANLTYIGVATIPEPGVTSLLLAAAALAGWAGLSRNAVHLKRPWRGSAWRADLRVLRGAGDGGE